MADAVRRYGTVWQTGSWQRSKSHFRHACELVRSGRIGEVSRVKIGLPAGCICDPQQEEPIPEGFDYDFWLGPAPEAPYCTQRCHWNYRWILDYSGGILTDWGAHHIDIANWGMGTEYTGPCEVEGAGFYPSDGLWDAAVDYRFEARYAAGASPLAPKGFTMVISNGFPMGARFEGTDGWIHVNRDSLTSEPDSLRDSEIGPGDASLCRSADHVRNFLDCIPTRAQTVTPIEVAHRAISVSHLGNIAMQLGRKVAWDPAKERFIDDSEAERMRARAMRGPWRL